MGKKQIGGALQRLKNAVDLLEHLDSILLDHDPKDLLQKCANLREMSDRMAELFKTSKRNSKSEHSSELPQLSRVFSEDLGIVLPIIEAAVTYSFHKDPSPIQESENSTAQSASTDSGLNEGEERSHDEQEPHNVFPEDTDNDIDELFNRMSVDGDETIENHCEQNAVISCNNDSNDSIDNSDKSVNLPCREQSQLPLNQLLSDENNAVDSEEATAKDSECANAQKEDTPRIQTRSRTAKISRSDTQNNNEPRIQTRSRTAKISRSEPQDNSGRHESPPSKKRRGNDQEDAVETPASQGRSVRMQTRAQTNRVNADAKAAEKEEKPVFSEERFQYLKSLICMDEIEDEDLTEAEKLEEEEYEPTDHFYGMFVDFDFKDVYKTCYFQPNLADNDVKVPNMENFEKHSFYLFGIPEDKEILLKGKIKKLKGSISSCLEEANILVFMPSSNRLPDKLITAAVGGRYLVPISYVEDSYASSTLLDINEYCSYEYNFSKFNLHPTTYAAIRMANTFRINYQNECLPWLYRHSILFAAPEEKYRDVVDFLRMSGAYVQPYTKNAFISNQLVTFVVTVGNERLPRDLRHFYKVPLEHIRKIMAKTLEEFTPC